MLTYRGICFVWDEDKNRANIAKHRVSFEDAATIFLNWPILVFFDPDHSHNEDRYVALGISKKQRILLVVHTENKKGTLVRLISARKANRKEQNQFWGTIR